MLSWKTSNEICVLLSRSWKYIGITYCPFQRHNCLLRHRLNPTSKLPAITLCFLFLIDILMLQYFKSHLKRYSVLFIHCIIQWLYSWIPYILLVMIDAMGFMTLLFWKKYRDPYEKHYIFTWCCKFWKLIDTKGQIFNDI